MKTKKLLSVVLTLCVLLVMGSLAAFAADGAATVGSTTYATLQDALAHVDADHPLTSVTDEAWPAETPVYYNGNFYKTLTEVLYNGISKKGVITADTEEAKIYCRPGAVLSAEQAHPCFLTNTVIYGNDASLGKAWEPCVEYSTTGYSEMTKDFSVTICNLHNGAGVWGVRVTGYKLDVTMVNCKNAHEIMINGQQAGAAASVNNYTVRNCTFDAANYGANCPITTTSAGKVVVENCAFTGITGDYVININNKNGGKTVVEVAETSFVNCGSTGKEVVRLTGEAVGSEIAAKLTKLTFDETSAANAIIIGNKKSAGNNAAVSCDIAETAGTMNVYKTGETTPETTTVEASKTYTVGTSTAAPVKVGDTSYATLESAIAAAAPDASGVITYEISGKAEVTATGWVQVAKAGLSGLKAVKFVGTTEDAEICIANSTSVLADQKYDIDVSFEKLTLSHPNGAWVGDLGHTTNYFACVLRNTDAAENTVTYTDCTFPNGVCNNLYGKTVFDGCKFTNAVSGMYNLWNYGGSTEVKNSAFTGVRGIKSYTEGTSKTTPTVTVAGTKFIGLTEKPAIVVSKATNVALNDVAADGCTKGLLQKDIEGSGEKTTIEANGTGISGSFGITAAKGTDAAKTEFNLTGGKFTAAVSSDYCADGFAPVDNADGTYGVVESAVKGTRDNPYTLAELGAMTRDAYIAAQNALGGTMYVTVGDYVYDKQGMLGNGKRDDTPHQTEDRSVLNGYNSNGYLGEKNDGANGKTVVFVGGNITSGATGYTSIDNIGTSLLLALPAYTHVQFEGTTFNNVISFDYQLYTGPWSQLGSLEFDGCTFNGLIVGAIASQELRFMDCTFTDYTNTVSANNSNPTWIRPAYGNWSKGDNEGQGDNFRSLTAITFENNKVTSTRPVKFERIAQWEMDTSVTVTGNTFNMSSQAGDTSVKNVGLYFGANAKFDLVAEKNEKIGDTAALYTAVYSTSRGSYAGLPAGSTVKNTSGEDVKLSDAYAWKTTDAIELKTTAEVAEVGGVKFATLAEAVAAAKTGETVTLLSDVTLDAQIAVSTGITIDGQGQYTITAAGKLVGTNNKAGMFYRTQSAKDTLTFKNVTLDGAGVSKIFLNEGGAGKTVFDGVTSKNGGGIAYGAGIHISGGGSHAEIINSTLIGSKGTMELTDANYYAANDLWVGGNVTVTVENSTISTVFVNTTGAPATSVHGKLIISGDDTKITYLSGDTDAADKDGKTGSTVTITGGTVDTIFDKGDYVISGGTFKTEVKSAWCADGFAPVQNEDGTYGVKKETASPFGKTASITNRPTVTVDGVEYYPVSVYTGIDSLNYQKVGFTYRVVATKTDDSALDTTDTKETTTVYTSINGTNNAGEAYTYTAEQFGGAYVYGQRFLFEKSSFTSANTTLYVTPFAVTLDGETVYGTELELSDTALAAYGTCLFKESN